MKQYDLIIIGAGPAGMTALVYATRAGLKAAMLEKDAPGGKLVKTNEIQNWPGIKETSGVDLALKFFDHATSFGGEYLYGDVSEIIDNGDIKVVKTTDGEYHCKAVIVATGTKERLLNIPNEQRLTGKGVSYCAVCDGSFYRNKEVCVIGGGNSALEEALYLTEFASKVKIVIRRDVFRAEPIIQKHVLDNPKIEIITKHIPVEIVGENNVEQIVLKNVETEELMTVDTSAVFPYIGLDPNTSFLDNKVLDSKGYIKVNEKMETEISGIYGAGDVIVKSLRQVVTATNDGAIAAQNVFHLIKG